MIVRNDKDQSLSRSYVYMKLTYVQRYFQENKNIIDKLCKLQQNSINLGLMVIGGTAVPNDLRFVAPSCYLTILRR